MNARPQNQCRGWTLLEFVAALALFGLVAVIVILLVRPMYQAWRTTAEDLAQPLTARQISDRWNADLAALVWPEAAGAPALAIMGNATEGAAQWRARVVVAGQAQRALVVWRWEAGEAARLVYTWADSRDHELTEPMVLMPTAVASLGAVASVVVAVRRTGEEAVVPVEGPASLRGSTEPPWAWLTVRLVRPAKGGEVACASPVPAYPWR